MPRQAILSIVLSLALSIEGLAFPSDAAEPVLDVRVEDQRGVEHDLGAMVRSGPVVVDFAASWCAPCYRVLPMLEALAREHPEVSFVVISVDDTEAGRDRLVRELGLDLPVIWDAGHRIVEGFSPREFPATYVLEGGEVIYHHSGTQADDWRRLVETLERLAEDTDGDTAVSSP